MPRAASLADELLRNYQHVIANLTLIPSSGGVFEVRVDDELVFSKKTLRRHAEAGEIFDIFRQIVGPDIPLYE